MEKRIATYRGYYVEGPVDLQDLIDKLDEIRTEQAAQHTALLDKLDELIAAVQGP